MSRKSTGFNEAKEEGLDAIDFIITVLREHEKSFDSLVERLSKSIDKMEYSLPKKRIRSIRKTKNNHLSLAAARKLENRIKRYKEKIGTLEKRIEELTIELERNSLLKKRAQVLKNSSCRREPVNELCS